MILEIILSAAIVVGLVVIWKKFFSGEGVSPKEEKYSKVDEKISEVRGRLRALRKKRPRDIEIDIKKYSD